MNILIAGLGLIGASLAKTIKKNTKHTVLGYNRTKAVAEEALADGVIDETGELCELIPKADITIVNFYPEAIVPFILENKALFKKESIVTDSCGIKGKICSEMARQNLDFTFIGGHPMAGREVSGYKNSIDNLFEKASFIFTPVNAPEDKVNCLCSLAEEMKFARCVVTTPEHHDEMIAFTSQIAHVVACSYILSPRARDHFGYSAGSYRDLSRVARINAPMWSELFIDNKEMLLREIETLKSNLELFEKYISEEDSQELCNLLSRGNKIKEEIG